MSFSTLSHRAQIASLRATALEALGHFPVVLKRLRLLNHGFNTTFAIESEDGGRYALRLNVNSRRSPQQIGAEMAWLAALAHDTDLRLPVPQPGRDGQLTRTVFNPALQRPIHASLFSWLPGRNLGRAATPGQLREVGRAAALLHAHAHTWSLPLGTALSSLRSPLMDSPNNLTRDHELLTEERREVIDETFRRVDAALERLFAADHPRPLHADLHPWNLRWSDHTLSVFDFDDSGIGVPALDLGIAAYYLRPLKRGAALEAALLEGYAAAAPLPPCSQADLEAVLAGRNLVLLNDLLTNTTANLRAMLPRYIERSVVSLSHFLETGVFRHGS